MAARALPGLSSIASHYDVLLCDVWGVVHDGIAAFPSAVAALTEFRRGGGVVVLITNAPRPSAPIIAMLDRLGVARAAWDRVISSGDTTRAMIEPYRGRVIHHIGPATEDDALYEGLGVTRGTADEAEVVVVTDLDHDTDTPETYRPRIMHWLRRGLPMICANPDRVVEIGTNLIYCGGALGDLYASEGGEVRMAGKPFLPIYEQAWALAAEAAGEPPQRRRALAIGDSVRTDATGAGAFGIDLLFITGSIHAAELHPDGGAADPEAVRALVAPSGAHLAGFMPRLAW